MYTNPYRKQSVEVRPESRASFVCGVFVVCVGLCLCPCLCFWHIHVCSAAYCTCKGFCTPLFKGQLSGAAHPEPCSEHSGEKSPAAVARARVPEPIGRCTPSGDGPYSYRMELAGEMRATRYEGPISIKTETSSVPMFSNKKVPGFRDTGTVSI